MAEDVLKASDGITGEWDLRRADEIAWIWARAGISQSGQRLVDWYLTSSEPCP